MEKKKLVKTEKDLSPAPILDKIKAFISPRSTAGLLRDRPAELKKRLEEAGG